MKILLTSNPPYSPSRVDGGDYLKSVLKKFEKNTKDILDIGCGKLYLLNILNTRNFKGKYLGIDPSIAKQTRKRSGKYITKNGDILSLKTSKKFDLITCLWVLEHIKEDRKAVLKMTKLLSKNGILIIAVPTIWTWPFEFGKHGFHYYRPNKFKKSLLINQLKVKSEYSAGGFLGFLFMIFYNWPRFAILLPSFLIYEMLLLTGTSKLPWPQFSKKVIDVTWYRYHKIPVLVDLHNKIIKSIVKIDNIFKIFPQSYIIILQKI
jgi:SAM-dependent methyltransferase